MNKNINHTTTTKSLGKIVTALSRKIQTCLINDLKSFNITMAEEPFFMALYHQEGLSQEQLTALAGVDKAATARAVKSLETKGMLTRIPDEKDRRKYHLYLTDSARTLFPDVLQTLLAFNEKITADIDENGLDTTLRTLAQVQTNLDHILSQNKLQAGGVQHEKQDIPE